MKNKKLLGSICCIISACLWGGCGASGQYLINELHMSSLWLTSFRLSICGIVLMLYFSFRMRSEVFQIWKNKKDAIELILFSLIGVTALYYTYFITVQYTNAATATVLQYLSPVLIVIYMSVRTRKRPTAQEATAVCFALAGTFLLATHGNFRSLQISSTGLFWGIVSAITLAFYTVFPRRLLSRYPTIYLYGWAVFFGAIVLNFISPFWQMEGNLDTVGVLLLLYTLFFGTLLSYPIFLYGVKQIGPARSSILSSLEPMTTAVITVVFLATPLHIMDIIGMVLITATVFILAVKPRRQAAAVEKNEKPSL